MSQRLFDLNDALNGFQPDLNPAVSRRVQDAQTALREGRPGDALREGRAIFQDGKTQNDRHAQAIAYATIAAALAAQEHFADAVSHADDCHRLYSLIGSDFNAAAARALLATIYRLHIDALSRALVDSLQDSRDTLKDMEAKALSKGARHVEEAEAHHQRFVEQGEQMRRARWIPALSQALPLVWLPVVKSPPGEASEPGGRPVGYMEPVVFALKTASEVDREQSGQVDPAKVQDVLYTARPFPPFNIESGGDETGPLQPPRLKPDAVYVAIKVDPATAHQAGLQPDDYLLVRSLVPHEPNPMTDESGIGFTFRMNEHGQAEVVKVVLPRFVAEEGVDMLNVKVDAVLRRVS